MDTTTYEGYANFSTACVAVYCDCCEEFYNAREKWFSTMYANEDTKVTAHGAKLFVRSSGIIAYAKKYDEDFSLGEVNYTELAQTWGLDYEEYCMRNEAPDADLY